MQIEMTPSQQNAYEELLHKTRQVNRRPKYLLLGGAQTGKSFLLQQLAGEHGFRYCNFTRDYLAEFMNERWMEGVAFYHLEGFLRQKFSTLEDQVLILDEVDSVLMLISHGDEYRQVQLIKQFLALDHAVPYILASAIFNESTMQRVARENPERVVRLYFLNQDKKHIQQKYFDNIGIFNFNHIVNLRQMLGK